MIPIRCFTCNKVIANKWETYKSHLESGLSKAEALDKVGLRRYCCRRMLLGHVELIDQLLHHSNANNKQSEEKPEKISEE